MMMMSTGNINIECNVYSIRYTKTSRSDDSVEHQLEVGYLRVTNLLPNEPFPEVSHRQLLEIIYTFFLRPH